ncbi:related to DHA14-like major facilitator efflux transporter (MFS transporter) [Phialocephala subalpina]|uniref:Related to DHA14-like major facilitator efflux transporter (MFS transporter) n=1 Tax=Phialocephala subalpina TaxID=576137 RepID=A0A1L7X7C3_9HELO|nr:related to DHA14-like major facilitator efflux transporter (MFS transporter) [Phialocephala subalpina]
MASTIQPAIEKLAPGSENEHSDSISNPATLDAGTDQTEPKEETPNENEGKLSRTEIFMLIAAFIAALEQTIVSTAIPTIAASFHISELEYTWIGTAYLLPTAAATPPLAKLSDIFGRKPILLLAIIIFFIGSIIGALATNIHMLMAGRVIQGTGAGGILGISATVIGDVFSPRERGKYYGIFGIVWGLAAGLGPIVGGTFSQFVSWRWCFWINLPVAGLAGIFVFLFLKVETPKTPIVEGLLAMDWLGTLFIVGATVMFLLGLGYGGLAYPWNSPTVICLIFFGIVTLLVFILIEWKVAKYPVIPLRLFRQTSNIATFGIAYLHGSVWIADLYYLPLYFQSVLGATPILSGVYLLPVVITSCVGAMVTGAYIGKTGRYRPPIYLGLAIMVISHGLYINLQAYQSWPRIIIFQIISGVGLGPIFQAPIISLSSLTKPADIASATATIFFARDIATAMSIVFGGVIFQNRMAAHSVELNAILSPEIAAALTKGDATASTKLIQSLPEAQKQVVYSAYNNSLRAEWIFYTALSGVGLLLSFLISKQVLSRQHKIHKTGLAGQEAARLEEKVGNKKVDEKDGVNSGVV